MREGRKEIWLSSISAAWRNENGEGNGVEMKENNNISSKWHQRQ
jgi:hypothetical protein